MLDNYALLYLSNKLLSKQTVNYCMPVVSLNTEINWMECVLWNIHYDHWRENAFSHISIL